MSQVLALLLACRHPVEPPVAVTPPLLGKPPPHDWLPYSYEGDEFVGPCWDSPPVLAWAVKTWLEANGRPTDAIAGYRMEGEPPNGISPPRVAVVLDAPTEPLPILSRFGVYPSCRVIPVDHVMPTPKPALRSQLVQPVERAPEPGCLGIAGARNAVAAARVPETHWAVVEPRDNGSWVYVVNARGRVRHRIAMSPFCQLIGLFEDDLNVWCGAPTCSKSEPFPLPERLQGIWTARTPELVFAPGSVPPRPWPNAWGR